MEVIILIIVFVVLAIICAIIAPFLNKVENEYIDYKKKSVGDAGERMVSHLLTYLSDKGKILENVYLPAANGGYTEIDTLFLTTDGIYVIESKNIYGDIVGDPDDREWTAVRGERIKSFRNPIQQNENHVKFLKKQLNHLMPVYSIIAFSDDADLSAVMKYEHSKLEIVHYSELRNVIDKHIEEDETFINEKELDALYKRLLKFTNVSEETKKEHINYIKEKYGE